MDILLPVIIAAAIALVIGVGLAVAAALFETKEHPLFKAIRGSLPGTNCGVCGYKGCDDYARAVAEGEDPGKCRPGKGKTRKAIEKIIGAQV
jgi:electron transport complex, RnfABCDGE type, B subunit